MWIRKRIDISTLDLLLGAVFCVNPKRNIQRRNLTAQIENTWRTNDPLLVSYSVRTAFDLALTALELPAGSEVLVSALTIPDMIQILEAHNLVPVPLDLDIETMTPSSEQFKLKLSPKTRAILVAHLFGATLDFENIFRLAKNNDLIIFEDCAQSFHSTNDAGNKAADISMFSFGSIKTCTALGGAVLRIKDPCLRQDMLELQNTYPLQSAIGYVCKLNKYLLIKLLCTKPVFTVYVQISRLLGLNYDKALHRLVRGFPGKNLLQKLRYQPSTALLSLLNHRLKNHRIENLSERSNKGALLAGFLDAYYSLPARKALSNTFWVFPIICTSSKSIIDAVTEQGFDATSTQTLYCVKNKTLEQQYEPKNCKKLLEEMVYLPLYSEIPISEIYRMGNILTKEVNHKLAANT